MPTFHTTTASTPIVGSSHVVERAQWTTRLAHGLTDGAETVSDWPGLLAFATRERCAALAWSRSHEAIRAAADPAVAERWRAVGLASLARGTSQLQRLARTMREFEEVHVEAVALKGPPLAWRLYGDATVRCSSDLDVWVPSSHRLDARRVLLNTGWEHADGSSSGDEAFSRTDTDGYTYLEVHSSLLHPRFDYLGTPAPESARVVIDGNTIRAMSGPLLAAYLSMNLAKHRWPPLIWTIDFATLWNQLSVEDRHIARWAADRCGLYRYLEWAVTRAMRLERVQAGEMCSLRALGLAQPVRSDHHPMWRHAWLAPSPRAAYRALKAWVAPDWLGESQALTISGMLHRIAGHWRSAFSRAESRGGKARWTKADSRPAIGARCNTLTGAALLDLVREIVSVGGQLWIVVTGNSMLPTLLDGDEVLLASVRGRVKRGEVVLADYSGSPLLHRIISVREKHIVMRGDARLSPDEALPRSAVIARALVRRRGTVETSLAPAIAARLRLFARQIGSAMPPRLAS